MKLSDYFYALMFISFVIAGMLINFITGFILLGFLSIISCVVYEDR